MAQSAPDLAALAAKLEQAQAAVARSERTGSARPSAALDSELKDLQDDLAYLRVKARRGERVSDKDRYDLDMRLTTFTARLGQQVGDDRTPHELPVGTELDVRLQTTLTSRTARVEDRVEATTLVDLYKGDQVLVPAGSVLSGSVTSVDPAQPHRSQGQSHRPVPHAASGQRHPRHPGLGRRRARERGPEGRGRSDWRGRGH